MQNEENLLINIQNKMPKLSKGHKLIASFILEHYDKAAYLTASKLGEIVGVSESTVVRFAIEFNYDGYPKLQKALEELIKNKLTTVQRMEVTADKISGKQKSILKTVLQEDLDNIKNTLEQINEQEFERAVDVILESKRIYILGIRSSGALASFLGFYLNLMFDNVNLVYTNSASEVFEQMLRVAANDVVIGISFPRYSKKTVRAMEYANARGATVIAITDGNSSPLVKYAHYSLIAKSNMVSFVDSVVAPMSIINALLVSISMKKKNEISQNFENLESIWNEYQVYNYDNRDDFYD